MATYVYSSLVTDTFPVGTTVGLYTGDPPPNLSAQPSSSPLSTAVVDSGGVLTITVPSDTADFTLGAQVSGQWRYRLLPARYRQQQSSVLGPSLVVAGGNSGAAYTLDCQGLADVLLTLTLTANCVLTISNRVAGGRVRLIITQDATGGRTLSISDGVASSPVTIPTGPGEFGAVQCDCPDSSLIAVSPLSVPGAQGIQGIQGPQGNQGVSGGGAAFVDPNNFSAVSGDMLLMSTNNNQPASGQMVLTKVPVTVGFTCSKITVNVSTGGSGLTAGQSFAAIYDSAGNRVGVTADQSGVWAAAGQYTMNLVTPVALSAGYVWVALLSNGTTRPTFSCAASSGLTNINATSSTARSGQGPGGQTSMPATITPASISLALPAFAIGLS